MRYILNEQWAKETRAKIKAGVGIDETLRHNLPASWLIAQLSNSGRPFKVYNLGAGVKRVTTETDVCPCCKKKL